jgi:hypothetical protein
MEQDDGGNARVLQQSLYPMEQRGQQKYIGMKPRASVARNSRSNVFLIDLSQSREKERDKSRTRYFWRSLKRNGATINPHKYEHN